jgi:predicted GIY-YIG superfamily endonuclease
VYPPAVPAVQPRVDKQVDTGLIAAFAYHEAGKIAIYRLFDEGDALLYAGMTNHLPRRLDLHSRRKGWWAEVRRMQVEWHDDLDAAAAAERAAIRTEWPKYNIHFNDHLTPSEIPAGGQPGPEAPSVVTPAVAPRHDKTGGKPVPGARPAALTKQARAAAVIRDNPSLTNAALAELVGCRPRTIQRARNGKP